MVPPKHGIVLLGPPGSGKTTLARALAARSHIAVIEMGNVLEAEIQRETPVSRQIQLCKAAGKLVPAEIVESVISRELERVHEEGVGGTIVLFDGFPRSLEQIEILSRLRQHHHLELRAVIVLELDLETAIRRISGRRVCSHCRAIYNIYANPPKQAETCDLCQSKLVQRPDDRIEVVQERFMSYQRDTSPATEFFRREFGTVTWEESATSPPDQLLHRVWPRLRELIPDLQPALAQ